METLRIGAVRIDNVVEMDIAFEPEWLLHQAGAADVVANYEALGPRLVDRDTGQLKLVVQSYLLRTPQRTILIDTCTGNRRQRPSVPFFHMLETSYIERLRATVAPEEVDMVVCSHLHVDHVGWNVRQDGAGFVPTFPNATYVFNEAEYCWWRDVHARGAGTPQAKASFLECVEPLVRAGRAQLVPSDHVLERGPDLEIRLEELPGHTLHQVGVHIRSGGRHAFFTADAVHHAIQFAHPGWRSRPDTDPGLGEATVRRLIATYADSDTIILTGHSPAPTACRLVRAGAAARLVWAA
ncbi:MBL fold metallo-hydrolase [Chelatococcus reniformis]|uniref:MBL fold metallo-hydrolase n=1 Tax=Chelatococcus reniformis TaxID=1494448 RepID=A0A916UM32_9HYPH|nr:MBL fold metallo-hydrolase [Chelatococcus reniformis]GGC78065.1 MBL fold metallo-hydrolase [Chelatococcus reniformis]